MNTQANQNPYSKLSDIPFSTELYKKILDRGAVVFGTGVMGTGIISTFLKASIPTTIQDISLEILNKTENEVHSILNKGVEKRKLSKEQKEIIESKNLLRNKIIFENNNSIPFNDIDKAYLESPESAKKLVSDFLIKNLSTKEKYSAGIFLETGPETLSFKQNIARFTELALESAIFATNTSSLKIDDIASKTQKPDNAIGFHYFFPSHINPLLEIILGSNTSSETLAGALDLAQAMGKKTIVCWKDVPGGIPNRILVGVLNEAAKIYDDGLGSQKEIDEVFLETFYPKQIKIKTKKAKKQFDAAPKLGFFKDEEKLYKKISLIDKEYSKTHNTKLLSKKKTLLEIAHGTLRQKILYANIVYNLSAIGKFFTPAYCVEELLKRAKEQADKLNVLLKELQSNTEKIKEKTNITPYLFPTPKNSPRPNKELISKRLLGAYIAISLNLYKENIGTIQDIELACKEGFKWNIGPFELMKSTSTDKVKKLIELVSQNLDTTNTGIANINDLIEINENELSGIQTYIRGNIGFIVLGRLHIQQLQLTQNSLSPEMLNALNQAVEDFETNKSIKAIIIKSQGGGPFSSGADLNYIESTNWDTSKITSFINHGKKVMDKIVNCKKPTIAIIDGAAVGGGLELALACDYRIITDSGFVAMPEVALGIIPDWGGTERLPRIIGKELAKRMICTATLTNLGLKLNSKDAYAVGLADASILQSELPFYMADLINQDYSYPEVYLNKPPIFNIYLKPTIKENYDKNNYQANIIKRFGLNKPYKQKSKWCTNYAATLAYNLIENSHNPAYSKRVNNDETSKKLLKGGKCIYKWYIKPFISAAQNTFWGPFLEKLGVL